MSYSTAQSTAPRKCVEYKTTRADKKFSPLSRKKEKERENRKRCADNDGERRQSGVVGKIKSTDPWQHLHKMLVVTRSGTATIRKIHLRRREMLLQITWQARKKVVPLVPVIATSHETRSGGIIPPILYRYKYERYALYATPRKVEQTEIISEIKAWSNSMKLSTRSSRTRTTHFPLLSFWIPTKDTALLQPADLPDGVTARCTHVGNRNRKPRRGVDHGRDK